MKRTLAHSLNHSWEMYGTELIKLSTSYVSTWTLNDNFLNSPEVQQFGVNLCSRRSFMRQCENVLFMRIETRNHFLEMIKASIDIDEEI